MSRWGAFNLHSKFEIIIFRLIDLVIFVQSFNLAILKFSVKLSKFTDLAVKTFYLI